MYIYYIYVIYIYNTKGLVLLNNKTTQVHYSQCHSFDNH